MIAAHRLSRNFGNFRAVDSIEFHVPRGSVVGLLGPNGAGKTTTIRMITGYLPPSSGSVRVDGLDVVKEGLEVRRRVGYLPESAPLYGEMRVDEYLAFRARLFGIGRRDRRAALDRAVERCWLGEVRRRPIHQLSKGYRQRVGLAAALLHEPPLLVLDEPTVGLDPAQILEVRRLIRELAGTHTIVLSTHILPEVEVSCDRVIMLARGRVHAEGSLDEVRRGAGDRYVVETRASAAAATSLESLPGARHVLREDLAGGWIRCTITAVDGSADLREAIAERLNVSGAVVRELHRIAPTLEQVFMRMMTEVAAPRTDGGGASPSGGAASGSPSQRRSKNAHRPEVVSS